MKKVSKKILTGTIAAAVIFGGAGLLHITQANAATGTSTVQNSGTSTNNYGKRDHGNNVIQEVATILGVTDPTAITDQLKQGKTLAQVAQDKGVTEDVLLQKLTDAENQSIDAAVTAGKITQAQADKQKSGLAARLKKTVENTGFGKEHGKGRGSDHEDNIVKEVATILGVTDPTTITGQLKQGKTLAQVAQDKGVTEDVLLQKLTDAENQSIDAAVTAGKITQAQADKQKSGLVAHLKKEVENTEQHDGHEKGGFADKAALSQILGITSKELTTNLQAGQSLAEIAQAKGINEDQLISKIKDSMTNKLKQYVEKKDQPETGDTPDAAAGATANAPTAGAAVDAPEAGDTPDAPASSNTASPTN